MSRLERLIDYIKDRIDAVKQYPNQTDSYWSEEEWAKSFDDLCGVYEDDLNKILEELEYLAYLLRTGKQVISKLIDGGVI